MRLQELFYLARDPSPGSRRQVEDSRRCGEGRPFAAQANFATCHVITIAIGSAACQAYRAGYSPLTLPSPPVGERDQRAELHKRVPRHVRISRSKDQEGGPNPWAERRC